MYRPSEEVDNADLLVAKFGVTAVARHQLKQKFGEALRPEIFSIHKSRSPRQQAASDFTHGLVQMLLGKTESRQVRTLGNGDRHAACAERFEVAHGAASAS